MKDCSFFRWILFKYREIDSIYLIREKSTSNMYKTVPETRMYKGKDFKSVAKKFFRDHKGTECVTLQSIESGESMTIYLKDVSWKKVDHRKQVI